MLWAIGLAIIAALAWFIRKGGKDAVKAQAAEESLDEIRKAYKPLSDPDLEFVRRKWRRD